MTSFRCTIALGFCSTVLLASETLRCDDQRGHLKISTVGRHYEIIGNCERIEIDGTRNFLWIEQSDALEVDGAENEIRISEVSRVEVDGHRNHLRLGNVGRIKVDGLENTLCYQRLTGKLETRGLQNRIQPNSNCVDESKRQPSVSPKESSRQPAAAGASRGTAPPETPSRVWGKECPENGKVRVTGVGSNVKVLGPCAEVEITGTGNRVEVYDVERVLLLGTGNFVSVRLSPGGKRATVVDRGIGNKVQEE
jgi:hypothetical protein